MMNLNLAAKYMANEDDIFDALRRISFEEMMNIYRAELVKLISKGKMDSDVDESIFIKNGWTLDKYRDFRWAWIQK